MNSDELVERLLTDEERAMCLAKLSVLNGGRSDGIHVRDALTIMYDADACLSKVEALARVWDLLVGSEWTVAHSMVVYVLTMLDRPVTTGTVLAFLARDMPDPDLAMTADLAGAPVVEVRYYRAGALVIESQYIGDGVGGREGAAVVSCGTCCALIVDDSVSRAQHARVAHQGEDA